MNPAEQVVVQHALQRGYLNEAQLEQARVEQARSGTPLLSLLRELFLTPPQVTELTQVYARASQKATSAGWATPGVEEATIVTHTPGTGRLAPGGSALLRSAETSSRPGDPGFSGLIGPYQVERELARGGMGVVYVARHTELGRPVALKLILAQVGGDGTALERFKVEAQAVAKLQHPNIVAVHDVGRSEAGHPYIAMDLVEGEGLDERLKREGALDPQEAAALVERMAQAMQHAHEQSILHRDLKPANVLIDQEGRPRITDFGLARDLSETKERLTRTGQLLGTPAYMPPEQAEGRSADVDERADIYSLGATLYALLTGEAPFKGQSAMNVVAAVLTSEVRPPRALRPEIDADLETIVLKCLEKVPADRYSSAGELANDLSRFSYKKPIRARRKSLALRLKRFGQRRPGLAAASIAFAAALLLVGAQGVAAWRSAAGKAARQDELTRLLEKGEDALGRKIHSRALTLLTQASSLAPDDPRPHLALAKTHKAMEAWGKALLAYDRGLELSSDSVEPEHWVGRARAYMALGGEGELRAALVDLNRASTAQVSSELELTIYGLRSEVRLRMGDVVGAAEDFGATLTGPRRTPEQLLRYAKRLKTVGGRLPEVRDVLEEAQGLDGESVPVALELALVQCLLGDYESAMALCEELKGRVTSKPDRAAVYFRLGLVQYRGRYLSTAISDFTEALKLDPNLAEAYAYRGLTQYAVLNNRRANALSEGDVKQALAIDPECAIAHAVLADMKLRVDKAFAEEEVARALAADPGCAAAYVVRACLHRRRKDFQQALADCDRAISLEPGDVWAHEVRSGVRRRLGDLEGSLADCDEVLARWPLMRNSFERKISIYTELGRLEDAARELRALIMLVRKTPRDGRGTVEAELKRLQLKLDVLEGKHRALPGANPDQALDPERSPPIRLYRRGKARFAAGRLQEAREDLEVFLRRTQIAKHQAKPVDAQIMLGKISRELGD